MYKVFINDKKLCFAAEDIEDATNISTTSKGEILKAVLSDDSEQGTTIAIKTDNPKIHFEEFISSFIVIEAAGGLTRYMFPDGDVLMIFRKGFWDLPKGKVDKGETIAAAAIREVSEECGINQLLITRSLQTTFHMYLQNGDWVVKKSSWFEMICSDNRPLRPQLEEDITEAGWIPVKEIKKLLPQCYPSIASLLKDELPGVG